MATYGGNTLKHFGVYGCGAWGIALAQNFSHLGKVLVYAKNEAKALDINEKRTHPKYPTLQLHERIKATSDQTLLKDADLLFYVAPVQQALSCFEEIKSWLPRATPVVLCSKGLIQETGEFLTTALQKIVPNPLYSLSGPNFAHEVIQGLPTASTFSGTCLLKTQELSKALSTRTLRLYASDDLVGVQICGALKNVLAIACGILHAKNLGLNAYSALITRGLAEIRRLGIKMGGKPSTFLGLSGVGDVTLTCGSEFSRNTMLGKRIGSSTLPVTELLKQSEGVSEGYFTAFALENLLTRFDVRMPIFQSVLLTLKGDLSVQDAIHQLLAQQETYLEEE